MQCATSDECDKLYLASEHAGFKLSASLSIKWLSKL